jgi:hypothetical protein
MAERAVTSATTDGSIQKLTVELLNRRENDNLMFARIREELDSISNAKKEDRVVITGLSSKVPAPAALEDRKAWMAKIVEALLIKLDPELVGNILFINQGRNNGRDIPMAEVRFKSIEWAKKARMLFVAKMKSGEDMGKIHMANSVCLATRVRVDILKAMAKQFSSTDEKSMYVSAYTSRPVLHEKRGEGQKPFAFTFADAIQKFGCELQQEMLGEAYKRAGRAFAGQLEQHFVVLKDEKKSTIDQPAGGAPPNSRKRPLADQAKEFERSGGSGIARGRGGWRTKAARR